MSKEAEWWTCPLEDEDGKLVMVTGRGDVEKFRSNPRCRIRIEITIPYESLPSGMPTDKDAAMIEEVLDRLAAELDKDPIGVITGVYTGAGERNIVVYAVSTNIFTKKLNQALEPMPLLPLKITAEDDPEWLEYQEMRELSEIK
ncbi:MAG: DUF695 domain-containing protein [Clostridium sp.]|nr:DUF695 domain-containing protein [Clostridium sp.]